jgi:hypothetical protein
MIIGKWRNNARRCRRNLSVKPNFFFLILQEDYVPHARRRICQLQTSALQPSLDKLFAGMQRKVVLYLSWFVAVTIIAFGPSETDMRAICCRQLFTATTILLGQSKEMFTRSASPDVKNSIIGFKKCTDTQNIEENKLYVTYYVIC